MKNVAPCMAWGGAVISSFVILGNKIELLQQKMFPMHAHSRHNIHGQKIAVIFGLTG